MYTRMTTVFRKESRIVTLLILTLVCCVVASVIGYVYDATSLFTDAVHKLSDAIALAVSLIAIVMSSKTCSLQNTYGWVRSEVLGALVNSVFLLALCFALFVHSIQMMTADGHDSQSELLLVVTAAGYMVVSVLAIFLLIGYTPGFRSGNLVCDCVREEDELIHLTMTPTTNCDNGEDDSLDDDAVMVKQSKSATGSQLNMQGVLLHVLMGLLSSLATLFSSLANQYATGNWTHFMYPAFNVFIVVIMATLAIPLMKESAYILLQMVPKHISVGFLKNKLKSLISGLASVHEIHIWRLEGDIIIATAHITINDRRQYMRISRQVKDFFHDHGIHSTTVQPEFVQGENPLNSSSECVLECQEDSCKTALCCTEGKGDMKQLLEKLEREPLIHRLFSDNSTSQDASVEANGNHICVDKGSASACGVCLNGETV